ncbi:MAG: hypothetical protein ACXWBQ_05210 [Usitatibacter sp.]
MRRALIALSLAASTLTPAFAQLSINFNSPGVSIGVNLGSYPTLQPIPGYPVYYAPGVNSNYFFYDGLYWDFDGNDWYESSWYNGPWYRVDPIDVPVYLLRVPVRYYRHAPSYFKSWRADDAPRWGDHWGQSWQTRRHGWDQWNRNSVPAPAPLPTYQRLYTGSRYPQASQQAVIATQNYRYQPQDTVAKQHFQHERAQAQSAPRQQAAPQQQQQQQQPQTQVPARARQERPPQSQPQPQQQQQQQREAPKQQPQQQQQREAPKQQPQPQQQQQREAPKQQPQQQQQREAPKQEPQKDRGKGNEKGNEKAKDNQDQRG